ncbi:3-hydroxyacyl-ACP dehydratase FabZ [Arenimonas fontis]|uniref:3-hydroxyacyl-[acyl-carrier-protein] dehydratase FabZ n=1 Tax=Arenimonas fontis TaxID=2608255 RepID=A0A5B2ZEC3_9GAMM|nr:3-hydroxyacyl-ACP dehydratase FabZ [Arenimonas fontis]KAA2286255.1 3-hydroxyacyl-ACP dehydratase FabZ [Arenimonas fontis]
MSDDAIKLPVDVSCILHLLPHRYPFLLVDRVVELEPHRRIRAIKNVTYNEPYFQGHFPGRPVMPGVLVIEAMAQVGGLLTQLSAPPEAHKEGQLFYLVKVDNARFSRMVGPGDQLDIEVRVKRVIRNMALYDCIGRVDGREVASAEILCAEGRE